MIAISLQSGSSGNCIYVEDDGVALLFDAGISASLAERRLLAHGRDIRDVDALIISHDHSDHVKSAAVFARKFSMPVFITRRTFERVALYYSLYGIERLSFFRSGETIVLGSSEVLTVPTPHDGVDGSAFVVASGGRRLGILTDLGHVFGALREVVPTLDGVFIESNYDPEMLARGNYPGFLKERIRGPRGHLSNREAAELLAESAGPGLRWACLCHLSGQNNRPEIALAAHREALGEGVELCFARRDAPSSPLVL